MYDVNYWGSHPDLDGDDCWYSYNFSTAEEALEKFGSMCEDSSIAYVEIVIHTGKKIKDATEVERVRIRPNPTFRRPNRDKDEWRREIATEAGMLYGCDAYNEEMGWD